MFYLLSASMACIFTLAVLYSIISLKWLSIPFVIILGYVGYYTSRFIWALGTV
jgi:hypothetical protein